MITSDETRETPDTELVQLLTPTGERLTHGEYAEHVSHLGRAELETMYRDMALVRRFDAEATALQRHGELGLWPPSQGQEGAQIGSAHALAPQDFVFPSYREHGVAQVRGLDLNSLLLLYRGQEQGGWDPFAHNFATVSLVIGSHTLHATGYGLGIQRDGDVGTGDPARDRCVINYFGDGASSQGDVSEALVFAASANAPVIFFCQNNQWAISVPATTQSRVPLASRGTGFGIPTVRVDGNDVIASYAVTAAAVQRAHAGGGPTFIEAVTYRVGAHTTSDDPSRYRSSAEEETWQPLDPLERLRRHLETIGTTGEFFTGIDREADRLGEDTRAYCRALTAPPAESMFEHIYATDHSQVRADRDWFTDYEAGFEETQV